MSDVFVKFRYEERDVASAFRSAMIASLRKRPDLGLGAIFLLLALGVAMRLTSGSMRVIVAVLAASVVVLVASSFVIVPKMMFRRERLHVPMGVDASDEGLTIIAGKSARTLAWKDILRVESGARVIIVHHGEEALIVPRRAFRSRDRERAFVELLEAHASRDMRRLESGKSTPSANA